MSTYKPALFYCTGQNSFLFLFLFFLGRGLGYLLILVCLRFKLNILFLRNLFQIKYFQNIQILFEKIHEIHKNAINTFFCCEFQDKILIRILLFPSVGTPAEISFCRNPSRYILLSVPQQRYPSVGTPAEISFCRYPSRDILLSVPQQGYPSVATAVLDIRWSEPQQGYPSVGTPAEISCYRNPKLPRFV